MTEGKTLTQQTWISSNPGSWKMSQDEYERTMDIGWRVMNKEPFTAWELSRFYINMGMLPKEHSFWTTRLEFTKNKRAKDQEKRKSEMRAEFEAWKRDNVTNEWDLCIVVVMSVLKIEDFRGEDNIIVLSKEFLRRDPKDNKKEAYGYYWDFTVSERDMPELFVEIKSSKLIFFKST